MEQNRTCPEHQRKKAHLTYIPLKPTIFSMFLGIQGVDFEEKLVEHGRNIEAEIRTTFFDDVLLICDVFWSHFGSQNGTKMASEITAKIDGFLDRSWKGSGAATGIPTIKSPPVLGPRGDPSLLDG